MEEHADPDNYTPLNYTPLQNPSGDKYQLLFRILIIFLFTLGIGIWGFIFWYQMQ